MLALIISVFVTLETLGLHDIPYRPGFHPPYTLFWSFQFAYPLSGSEMLLFVQAHSVPPYAVSLTPMASVVHTLMTLKFISTV